MTGGGGREATAPPRTVGGGGARVLRLPRATSLSLFVVAANSSLEPFGRTRDGDVYGESLRERPKRRLRPSRANQRRIEGASPIGERARKKIQPEGGCASRCRARISHRSRREDRCCRPSVRLGARGRSNRRGASAPPTSTRTRTRASRSDRSRDDVTGSTCARVARGCSIVFDVLVHILLPSVS